jgi:hypothetical protein
MTADAVNLLTEIRRAGGDVRLVGCNRLKLVAPITLLPELAERVRAAKPMLLAVLADNTSTAQRDGEGVSYPPSNRATAQHSPAETSSDRYVSKAAADWLVRHREALAYWRLFHVPSEAARLAWGEMENEWHQLHGEHIPSHVCAGCGELIGGLPVLEVGHGSRVHIGDLDCVIRFGERWRAAATAGLRAIGLSPAEGSEPL